MNAYRIENRVVGNHLLHIAIPTFAVGEDVEVIILAKEQAQGFEAKIQRMKQAASDPLFPADAQKIAEGFRAVDRESWVNE